MKQQLKMSERWYKALEVQQGRLERHVAHLAQHGAPSREQRIATQQRLQANDLKMVKNLASVPIQKLKQMRILEIGGVRCVSQALFAIKTRLKIVLDPLADLWHRYAVIDHTCDYVCGVGENIPLQRNSMDLCWCANVIDHVLSPPSILREIRRVLSNDGVLVISCNVYSTWTRPLFPIFDRLDGGHPHHFTEASFRQLLTREFDIRARFAAKWGKIENIKVLFGIACGAKVITFRCTPRS